MDKKRIAILGSTGSIGRQALEVVREFPGHFEVEVLTCHKNANLLVKQAKEFSPNAVVIADKSQYALVSEALSTSDIKVFAGEESVEQIVEMNSIDMVLDAIVGYAGLKPLINALKSQKNVALANKESLVVAGELVTKIASENRCSLIPVDSEHSAIYQCLIGESTNSIEKIILTASGGPFRGKEQEYLKKVTRKQALDHPNWNMGDKITIDSATLMNKGLEVIEAKWLFGLKPKQIEVIIHPQSIIHSMVQFVDGNIKAQMGPPDMRMPIQYAMFFPHRMLSELSRISFSKISRLSFEPPDLKNFRNLALAIWAMKEGGNMPCILNAANEVAVKGFLTERVKFLEIPQIVEHSLHHIDFISNPGLEDYFATDRLTRKLARTYIENSNRSL